jgi:hypothetical protein
MARRLTVLAGAGPLVDHVVDAALAAGDTVQVVGFTPRTAIGGVALTQGDSADPAGVVRAIAAFASTHVTMAGAITLGDRQRETLASFASGGQAVSAGDAALSGLAETIQRLSGAMVIGAHEVAADLLAPVGRVAGPALAEAQLGSARLALSAAREIGRLDLGQAVVMAGARVVAAEDVGGTDELIARVAEHRRLGRIGDGSAVLILAKAAKPQQPLYVDLPAIGARTVAGAAVAGIAAIVVEAGKSLVLQRAELASEADRLGISVIGLGDA